MVSVKLHEEDPLVHKNNVNCKFLCRKFFTVKF